MDHPSAIDGFIRQLINGESKGRRRFTFTILHQLGFYIVVRLQPFSPGGSTSQEKNFTSITERLVRRSPGASQPYTLAEGRQSWVRPASAIRRGTAEAMAGLRYR
jgi:hypothetical protein